MAAAVAALPAPRRRRTELALFLRRWLAHPLRIGAITPSAPALARAMARAAQTGLMDGDLIVELGPGTGSVTRALIAAGVPEERLILVERDRHLYAWLKGQLPRTKMILSDARQLDEILPPGQGSRVSTVVSSLPLNSLPRTERDEIVRAVFRVLSEDGSLVQYSYGVPPPLPCEALGLTGQRVAFVAANLPPASVWRFSRRPSPAARARTGRSAAQETCTAGRVSAGARGAPEQLPLVSKYGPLSDTVLHRRMGCS